jgi:tetratricopeptide (TPR) repeat protein
MAESDDDRDEPSPADEETGEEGPDPVVRELLERAHELGDEGDFQAMAERLREALHDHPGDPYLLCWLGVAERELGMAGVAYERFRACLEARPTDPNLLATAGNGIAAFDDPDALGALRTAALLGPDLAVTRWLYGAYLIREGMSEEGLAELTAARDLDPEDAGVRYELGVGFALAGRRSDAIDELYRSIEMDAADGWAHVVLGLLLADEARAEEAAGVLEEGARLRPEDIEAQLLAALAAAAFGSNDTAFEMVERARQWAEGGDRALVDEVESRVDEGAEESASWLSEQLGPPALRDRMMTRP